MSPRGRPTNEPRSNRESFRLSQKDSEKLLYCIEHSDMSKTDVLCRGIDLVYEQIKKEHD